MGWSDWLLLALGLLAVYLPARSLWLYARDIYRGERP